MDKHVGSRTLARPPQAPVPAHAADDAPTRPRPGGFWLRVWAWLYDSAILAVVLALLTFLVKLAFGFALVAFVVGLVERGLTGSFGAVLALLAFFLGWLVTGLVVWLLGQFLGWLYYAFFESSQARATPGKRLMGLAVVDARNERISFLRATARHVFKLAALFPAMIVFLFLAGKLADPAIPGSTATAAWLFAASLAVAPLLFVIFYGMAGWTHDRRALHDMLSGCYVVRSAELSPGRAFALAVGGVAVFLVVWIASHATFTSRAAPPVETRTVAIETAPQAAAPRPDPAPLRVEAPAERTAAATASICSGILAAHPDSILGPTPVVIADAPGRMCRLAATPTQEAASIRVEVLAAREFRGRERLLREYAREPSPTTTMREEAGLGDRAIVRIEGNGRFVTYFVLRGERTIEIEFWQVTSHDAARARAIAGRVLEQIS